MQHRHLYFLLVSVHSEWTQLRAVHSRMCKNGRWYSTKDGKGVYAYKPQLGLARGGNRPGPALTSAQAKGSIDYCVAVLGKDKTCSTDFIGVNRKDGHCLCVNAGDTCNEVGNQDHGYQFQKGLLDRSISARKRNINAHLSMPLQHCDVNSVHRG